MNRSGWKSPAFADIFVGCEALQGLPATERSDEIGKVSFELIASIVIVALDDRFLDRAVHALDLAIGPGMLDLGQPMFDAISLVSRVEHMRHVSCRRTVDIAWREGELDPIVGEHRVDLVGDGRDQSFEEGRGLRSFRSLLASEMGSRFSKRRVRLSTEGASSSDLLKRGAASMGTLFQVIRSTSEFSCSSNRPGWSRQLHPGTSRTQ